MLTQGWWQDTAEEIIASVVSFRGELKSLAVSKKADNTLLTEADVAIQDLIVRRIRRFDTDSIVIAEEDGVTGNGSRVTGSAGVWIIDPIDGTSQFVQSQSVEFCTAIARYEGGLPVAALVVAPELGVDRTPIIIEVSIPDNVIRVNQEPYRRAARELTGCASTTRRTAARCPLEESLLDKNYEVKTSATSQTLDMVRTAIDLTSLAPHATPFDLFHRRQQKLWDGAAGICLAVAAGLIVADEHGDDLLPLSPEVLKANPPQLASSVVCHPELAEDVLRRQPQPKA